MQDYRSSLLQQDCTTFTSSAYAFAEKRQVKQSIMCLIISIFIKKVSVTLASLLCDESDLQGFNAASPLELFSMKWTAFHSTASSLFMSVLGSQTGALYSRFYQFDQSQVDARKTG